MITSMMGRMADAEKLSIPQLQMAIKNGSIPAYVGVPLLQDKMKQHQQALAMRQAEQSQLGQDQVPVAAQVMQEAGQYRGIDELPTNLPTEEDAQAAESEYANGGIIAFADEGQVREPKSNPYDIDTNPDVLDRMRQDDPNAFQRLMRSTFPSLVNDARIGSFAGTTIDPNASSTVFTPSVKETPFTKTENPKTGAALLYRRQHGASNAPTPDLSEREQELIPKQDVDIPALTTPYTATPPTPAGAKGQRMAEYEPGVAALPAGGAGGAGAGAGAGGAGGAGAGGALPPTLAKAEAVADKSPVASQAVSMIDKYVAMLEKSGQDVGRDKKEALYMALIKGGLAAAGGTSPNALANIAAGMVPAVEGYAKDIAGIRKDERARLEKLVAAGVSKEKIGLEAKKLGITEKHYDDWYKAETAKLGLMAGSRADARAQAEDLKRLSVAQGLFKTLRSDQMMSGKSDDELWNQAQIMSGQIETPAAPKSNIMGSYVPGKGYVPAGK
jgi:hypothetical protein